MWNHSFSIVNMADTDFPLRFNKIDYVWELIHLTDINKKVKIVKFYSFR